jgi:hypothetical protein
MKTDTVRNAIKLALRTEQTEAYIFADVCARYGATVSEVNAVIADMIADGTVVESIIMTPPAPYGHGNVDSLRLAA